MVEPLEQVVDELKDALRTRHIQRLQSGVCSIDAGFVLSDLLTNLERVSDHCSNIAGCVLDAEDRNLNLHESLSVYRKSSEDFRRLHRTAANMPCRHKTKTAMPFRHKKSSPMGSFFLCFYLTLKSSLFLPLTKVLTSTSSAGCSGKVKSSSNVPVLRSILPKMHSSG